MTFEEIIGFLRAEMAKISSLLLNKIQPRDAEQLAEKLIEYRTLNRMIERLTAEDERLDKD